MRLLSLYCLAMLCLIAGCGPSKPPAFPVEGSVSYMEIPVENGTIIFYPKDVDGESHLATIQNGRYIVDVTAGAKMVEITADRVTKEMATLENGEKSAVVQQYIPEKYNYRSGLFITVEPGPNCHDFHLKK